MKMIFFSLMLLFFFAAIQLKSQSKPAVAKYISEKQWNQIFPNRYAISTIRDQYPSTLKRKDFYCYSAFIKAAKRFPTFLSKGTEDQKKRELAAFLASIAHETSGGWDDAPGGYFAWGLYFLEERGYEKGNDHYSDTSKKKFPPVKLQSYHGRGPMQLSWNYNYAQFSKFYFGNQNRLLQNPSLVSTDPVLCFASAFWFWVTPQYPKPSCHEIMAGLWEPEPKDIIAGRVPGFGAVMNVINGGLECGVKQSSTTAYRLAYYQYFCKYLKVESGANCGCANMRPFGQ